MEINVEMVKKHMNDKGLTAEDLAKIMGIHRQTVYDLFSGKTGRTFRVVRRLAKALHVKETDIIS